VNYGSAPNPIVSVDQNTNRINTSGYAYDAGSNRASATLDGTTVNYAYDTLNRLTNLTSGFAGQFTFGYDALSRRTSLNRPNAVNTTYMYDSVSRLLSVLHQLGLTTIDGASYGVDAAGNRVSKTNYIDSSNENYTYDALYQLTQVVHNGSTSETYTYDGVGNRLSSLGVPSYTVNSSNELTSTSSATFAYDNNGNTTSKTDPSGTTSYTWDFENRLVSVTLPGTGGTVTFKYDPLGRRIQKASPSGTMNFAYDGANVVEELNAAGTITAQYAQGTGVDQPLATNRGGVLAFYEADGLGSVTSLTDNTGSALAAYTTDAFGKPVSTADSTVNNPFRYTAREYDSETGLYYYRARYYDPAPGKFLSEDPVGFSAGVDFYRYVSNSPVDLIDPSGLWSTAAHHQILWNAFHGCKGISDADIYHMQQGSDYADSDVFQGPEYSYIHAMSNGTAHQSAANAQQQTASFIATQMVVATNQYNAGAMSQAMFTFGVAMHPMMDMTSPAHTDPNGRPIPWCGMMGSCSNTSQHGGDSWYPQPFTIEDVAHLNANPEIQELETFLLRTWFEMLTGRHLDCGCKK
jgi:RHS repeat-associated protein